MLMLRNREPMRLLKVSATERAWKCAPEPRREEMPARPAALRPLPVLAGQW